MERGDDTAPATRELMQIKNLSALLSQDSTYTVCCHPKLSLPSLPAGVGRARGAAGVRRVCGVSVGPRAICHVRLAFVFITSKAKLRT